MRKKRQTVFWNTPEKAAYFFVLPSLLIMTVFVFVPLISAFVLGLFKMDLFLSQPQFVGLENLKTALADTRMWNAFKNTVLFTLMVTPVQLFCGIFVASLVYQAGIFNKFVRSVSFLPVVCSMTAVGIMCSLILDPNVGVVPYLIFKMGFPKPMMLKDPSLALPTIALITVWKNFGQTMIIMVAGMGGINGSYYEAAQIDGATRTQQLFRVTIPLLIPSISFCTITNLIASFQVFDQVYVTTRGGPLRSTETAVQYIYSRGFSGDYNLGYASSIAFLLFVLIVTCTLLLNRWLKAREQSVY